MLFEDVPQPAQHLVVGEFSTPGENDSLYGEKEVLWDDSHENTLDSHPFVRRVLHVFLFQFERGAVVNIVADVFLIRQHFMHSPPCPGASNVGHDSLFIECRGYL